MRTKHYVENRKVSEGSERTLLAGCIADKKAYFKITKKIKISHIGLPVHQIVYEALQYAVTHGLDIAPETIEPILSRKKEALACYRDIANQEFKPENIDQAITTVSDRYQMRHLLATIEKFDSNLENPELVSAEILNNLNLELEKLGNTTVSTQFTIAETLAELIPDPEKMEPVKNEVVGVASGLRKLDLVLSGAEPGDVIYIGGEPSSGKALAMYSKVLTPDGYKLNTHLTLKDRAIGTDGKAYNITGIFPQGKKPMYTVEFDDGSKVDCSEDHLWKTRTKNERSRHQHGKIRTTKQILDSLIIEGTRLNHSVVFNAPVELNSKGAMPVIPYLLGVWLGDGSISRRRVNFHNSEFDIRTKIANSLSVNDEVNLRNGCKDFYVKRKIRNNKPADIYNNLKDLKLHETKSATKFIPQAYLFASIKDRVALLQGLVDTDGYTDPNNGAIEYCTKSEKLKDDILFLVRSLGGRASFAEREFAYTTKSGERISTGFGYRIYIRFYSDIIPVSSVKHLTVYKKPPRVLHRKIKKITYIGKQDCQCISVDSPDHLFLCDDFVVTHNTQLALQWAIYAAKQGEPIMIFSLETERSLLMNRLLTHITKIDGEQIKLRRIDAAQKQRWLRGYQKLSELPIILDEEVAHTPPSIANAIRRQQHIYGKIGMVIIDFIQLLADDHKELKVVTRQFQNYAKSLGVPFIIISQLNRDKQRHWTSAPKMTDFRESSSIESSARKMIAITSEPPPDDSMDQDEITEVRAFIWVIKNKDGAKCRVPVINHLNTATFNACKMFSKDTIKKKDDSKKNFGNKRSSFAE